MKTRSRIVFMIFFLTSFISNHSQNAITVITTGTCIGENLSPSEARRKALDNARAEAIKQAVGTYISEETYRKVSENNAGDKNDIYDAFSRLSFSTSFGKIVNEEILEERTEIIGNIPEFHAKIKVNVMADDGPIDPEFNINMVLKRDVFYDRGSEESDEIDFLIEASKDCYIYVFNIMANDSVKLILPNSYIRNTFYSVDLDEQIYESELKRFGMSFPVKLRDGYISEREALYAIALKNENNYILNRFLNYKDSSVSVKVAITDIQSWLVKIPRNERTEAIASFEIRN